MDRCDFSTTFTLLAREYAVPGAQLVIAHGDDEWGHEFGHTECGTGVPMSRDAKVPIGSITKAFTAALALVLVSDGDLELDEPIAEHLPGPHDDGVTLRHLLSHTAGLPSAADANTTLTSVRRRALDSRRRLVPLARPGLGFSYSNLGYVVVGHLIEVVTGMTWWEAMSTILLTPLGIEPAFVVPAPTTPVVTGHSVNQRRVRPVEQSLPAADAPAGALAASASDLVAFGRMLLTGDTDLIDPALLTEMRQPAPGAEPYGLADGWGLGLALFRTADGVWLGHDGTADGTACHLRLRPDDGTVVALTTNANTGFAMWDALSAKLFASGLAAGGRGIGATRRVPPPPDCTGSYRNGDTEYSVVGHGAGLRLEVDGDPFAELACYDGLRFEVHDADDDHPQAGRFLRDPRNGRIDMLQLSGRLARRGSRERGEHAA